MKFLSLALMALLSFTQLSFSPDANAFAGRTREELIAKNVAKYNKNVQKINMNNKKIELINRSIKSLNIKAARLGYRYGAALGTLEAFGIANDMKINKNEIKEKNLELLDIQEENKFLIQENQMLLEENKNL